MTNGSRSGRDGGSIGQRRSPLGLACGDVPRDVRRVPADAGKHVRGDRVLEDQPHEVQTGLGDNDAAFVDRRSGLVEDGQVDPREVVAKPRAPDHVRHVEDVPLVQQWQTVADADDAWNSLNAETIEVVRLDADQRRGLRSEIRTDLPSHRRSLREHSVAEETDDAEGGARRERSMTEGDLRRWLARHPRRMGTSDLQTNLRSGVTEADDEDPTFDELLRTPVVARVQLHDPRIELEGEVRNLRCAERSRCDDDAVGLESLRARAHHVAIT